MSSRRPRVKVAANLSIRRAPKPSTGGEQLKTPDAITSCPNDTSLDSTEVSAETPVGNVPAETVVKVDEVLPKQDKQEKQDKQDKQDEQHFKLPKPVDDVPKHNAFHNSVSGVDSSSSQNSITTTNINNNNNNNNEEPMSPRKQEARLGFPFPLSRKRNRTESLTSNKSLPEGITVNKVHRKVATKQEESQRTQENKKEARKRLTNIDNVNKQNLTMFDMIYYNPSNNPMETPALSKRGSLDNIPKALEGRHSRSVSKSRSPTPAPAPAFVPKTPVQLTPQLKLGPNGEMILDEASLVIENEREKEMRETLASNEIVYQDEFSGNSGYYSRIRRTKDWTNEETIRFYRCLHTIGTDFSMMLTLFPYRSRRDLKLKFKKEERLNLQLVNKALQYPKQFKLDELKQQFAQEDEELERIKEEQQRRAQESQEKLRQEKLNKKLMLGISKGRNPKKRVTKSERAMMDGTEEMPEAQEISNMNNKPKRQRRKKTDGVPNEAETPIGFDGVESVLQSTDSVSVKGEGTMEPTQNGDHSLTKVDVREPPENPKSVKRKSQTVKGEGTLESIQTGDHSHTKADVPDPPENPKSAKRKRQSVKGEGMPESIHTGDHSLTKTDVANPPENPESATRTRQSVKGEGTPETIHTSDHSLRKVDALEPPENTKCATRKPQTVKGEGTPESIHTGDHSHAMADVPGPPENPKSAKCKRQSMKGEDTAEPTDTVAEAYVPEPLEDPESATRKRETVKAMLHKLTRADVPEPPKNPKSTKRKRRSRKGKSTPESIHTIDHSLTKNPKAGKRRRRSRKFKPFKSKKKPSITSERREVDEYATDLIELELPSPDQYIPNGAVDTISSSNAPNAAEANCVDVKTRTDTSTVCQPCKIGTTDLLPLVEIPAAIALTPVLQTTPVIMLESLNTPSSHLNVDSSRSKQPCLIDEMTPVVIKYDGTEPDLEYLPLPGANAPIARKVRLDTDASCALDESREPLMELEPAKASSQKSRPDRSPTVANTSPPGEASVGGNVPGRSASPIRHKMESDTDPPVLPAFPKMALDDEDDPAEYSEENECYVADEPIPEGDDDYHCTKVEEPDLTKDGYLCETVAEISIGMKEISTAGHHEDLPRREIVAERTKKEEKMENVDLPEVDVEGAAAEGEGGLGADVAPDDEDANFSLEDIDINSLVLVESQDTNRPDKTIYEIYVVNPATGQLSEKPLDVPADVIGNIRAILEAGDGGS
uniref:Myb-like domain-containing protein n=1 Tax=Anopheles atroparvus TaxID=41427 RepID=A0AAG5DT44_ANOAO